jgi:hypothetical protein
VGAHEGRAGRGPSRAVREAGDSNPSGSYQWETIFSMQSPTQGGCSQNRPVKSPHLHSQKQTLSAACRVEQA